MKHHHHAQHPYSDEIKRHLFTRRTSARAVAAIRFLFLISIFAGLGVLLAWRG